MDALLSALEANFARQTVASWEFKFAASIIVNARVFHESAQLYIKYLSHLSTEHNWDCRRITWGIHSVVGDGTNTAAIHYKAHVVRVSSLYNLHCLEQKEHQDNSQKSKVSHKCSGHHSSFLFIRAVSSSMGR